MIRCGADSPIMKVCSICHRSYADSLKFCLEDGTVLSPAPPPDATLVDPQATLRLNARVTEGAVAPPRKMNPAWIVLGVVGIVLIGSVVGVLLLFQYGSSSTTNHNAAAAPVTATNSPAPAKKDVAQELERLNSEVGSTMVNGDPDALSRLLADDYRYVSDVGLTLNKLEVLALIRTGNLTYEYLRTSEAKIEVNAELNKGIVNALGQSKGTFRRQPFTDTYFYSNTYEKRDGRWQLVSGVVWHRQ